MRRDRLIDIHAHLLPELDDGAKSWDEFLQMSRVAVDDGVTHVAVTPHMLPDGKYANRSSDVLPRVEEARAHLADANIPLQLIAGAEVYLSPTTAEDVKAGRVLTYGDMRKYVLVEFPVREVPLFAERVMFEIQLLGTTPILAHVERYFPLMDELERLEDWVERGILLQVNARSLLGDSGDRVKRSAEELLDRRMVHIVASDAHDLGRRPPGLSKAKARVEQVAGLEVAEALTVENPRRVLAGEPVERWEIRVPQRRPGFLRRLFRR